MESREMYAEVNALVGAMAKALDIAGEEVARAIEAGEIAVDMEVDERGERFIAVSYKGQSVRIYEGAIRYAAEPPPAAMGEEPDDGCADGGCGCGR